MAPKNGLPAAKVEMVLKYFQGSRTAHTLKELEKALPSVASINGMHVKEYLQTLTDDNKIHVEKIGSGNWYWSFLSEEKHQREVTLGNIRKEKGKIESLVQDLEEKMREAKEKRGDDKGRSDLIERKAVMEADVVELRTELAAYKDCDPSELEKKRVEIETFKAGAERWTDNIGILEAYIKNTLMGGDVSGLEQLRQMVFGSEYVEGEGLRELEMG